VAREARRATTHGLNYGPLLTSPARCCSHRFIYSPTLLVSWLTLCIEYDNDPEDPEKPTRSAHESAIFAHLRRIPPLPPQRRRSVDYLSIELPGDETSGSKTEPGPERITSQNSGDGLRNPFGRDTVVSDGALVEEEGEMEVDLASWGLSSFIPKEKGGASSKNKGKENVTALPNPHATTQASSYRSTRSMSMGNLDSFGTLDSPSAAVPDHARRRSLGSALELGINSLLDFQHVNALRHSMTLSIAYRPRLLFTLFHSQRCPCAPRLPALTMDSPARHATAHHLWVAWILRNSLLKPKRNRILLH
jgi:hypothetical protein